MVSDALQYLETFNSVDFFVEWLEIELIDHLTMCI